jgi:phosphate:Na+ symporter
MSATINLENLADVIETEMVDIFSAVIDMKAEAGEATRILLDNLYGTVKESIQNLVKAVREDDERAAASVLAVKQDISRIANEFLTHQSERIGIKTESHLALIRLEMELMDKLRQIYTLTKRIARDFVPAGVVDKA